MSDLTRRRFVLCTACALAWLPRRARAAGPDPQVARFDGVLEGALPLLARDLGDARAREVVDEARAAFGKLLPALPDVGGEANPLSRFLPMAGWYVALYGPMRARGRGAEDVGRLLYDLNLRQLERMPPEAARAERDRMFSPAGMEEARRWAAGTQRRDFPANWVARFVEGDGKTFDFGIDYLECGLVKYFRAQGVPELAPFVCPNDFPSSAAIGSGLRRKGTLAQGDRTCDFRYGKGRAVTQDWATEIVRIRRTPAVP